MIDMSRKNGWEPYVDEAGDHRWRVWSQGRITAEGAEGYENSDDMVSAVEHVSQHLLAAIRSGELDDYAENG
jgi:hypothetical protein